MKKLKRVLPNNDKTRQYIDNLPKIYLVGCWAHYGVMERPFTGEYIKTPHYLRGYKGEEKWASVPLVYDYEDGNGTCDEWRLRPLTNVTTGTIYVWTESKGIAEKIAEALELQDKIEREKKKVEARVKAKWIESGKEKAEKVEKKKEGIKEC